MVPNCSWTWTFARDFVFNQAHAVLHFCRGSAHVSQCTRMHSVAPGCPRAAGDSTDEARDSGQEGVSKVRDVFSRTAFHFWETAHYHPFCLLDSRASSLPLFSSVWCSRKWQNGDNYTATTDGAEEEGSWNCTRDSSLAHLFLRIASGLIFLVCRTFSIQAESQGQWETHKKR